MRTLSNLSDAQTKEIYALFHVLDTNSDNLLSPRSAHRLCEALGFHPDMQAQLGARGFSTPVSREDVLQWLDTFCGQAERSDEIRLAQRFALLKSCDQFADSASRVTRAALESFLASEQHKVQPEVVEALLDEVGDGHTLTKVQMASLLREKKSERGAQSQRGRSR